MTTITKDRLLTIQQWRETYGPGSMRYVSCKCGAQGPEKRTKSEAISSWNSRMKVWVYDPETILNVEERRRTEVYIHNLNEDGFTPVLVKATPQEINRG